MLPAGRCSAASWPTPQEIYLYILVWNSPEINQILQIINLFIYNTDNNENVRRNLSRYFFF
jgi:hypothetical protein